MEAEYLQYWEGEKNPENDANLNIAFIGASSLKNKSEINNNFYVNISIPTLPSCRNDPTTAELHQQRTVCQN